MTTNASRKDSAYQTDLTNCDREPIHLIGSVQAYGCLIATTRDFRINHLSRNCEDMLGLVPEDVIGASLIDVLPEEALHHLRSKLQQSGMSGGTSRIFAYDVFKNGVLFDIAIHASGQSFVFEFEPKQSAQDRDDLALVQPLMDRVRKRSDLTGVAQEAALALQSLSGFARVMVYRFAEDGSGEVIAERRKSGLDSFLGMRFPASDIPKQARELYKRNKIRLIADVDGDVSPLLPHQNPPGVPLDLSMAVTRALSPIHLEYLRNMGVAASMSVSILKDGELWGLLACHHPTAHYVDYERRTAIELFAQLLSYEIERQVEFRLRDDERNARALHDRLLARLSSDGDLISAFDVIADELSAIVPSDGVAIFSNGQFRAQGQTPNAEEFSALARFLNTTPSGAVFVTDKLLSNYPAADIFSDRAAGLLAVPISQSPRDYIVFFRSEIAREINWAGDPEKPVDVGPNGIRLTPRKSFEIWTEMVRNRSAPWRDSEVRAADALRVSLIEIVLKMTNRETALRQVAVEKQELLIAELNHRVRNILNLIVGLVSQSKGGDATVEPYTKVLGGRIQSLARAHDQLTRQEWEPSSLRELIEVEANAYLNAQHDQIEIAGDAPLLAPSAISALALVMHEMMTNSAKYGALSVQHGKICIKLSIEPDKSLVINWREQGGPPVHAPERRGFGSTIIERIIPYELNGRVETRFKLVGFEADILIPAKHISQGPSEADVKAHFSVDENASGTVQLHGTVMVLEDNMIIALDASDALTNLGAEDVQLAGSVEEALSILSQADITFAMLDINLGNQTSLLIAQELDRRQMPFVLATGYNDVKDVLSTYPDAPVVGKPFTSDSLASAVKAALTQRN